jgi:hypothetical protein
MRFKTYVAEAIQNEPRHITRFHTQRMKDIQTWEPMAALLKPLDSKICDDFMTDAFGYRTAREFQIDYLAHLMGRIAEKMADLPRWYSTIESVEDVMRLTKLADHSTEDYQTVKKIIAGVELEEILSPDSKDVTTAPAYADWEKNVPESLDEIDAVVVGLETVIPLYRSMSKFFDVELPKLKEWANSRRRQSLDGEYEPERDKVETLYHATTAKSLLLSNGFTDTRPEGVIGLGEFAGSQNKTVSFTHDLQIAREIMRSLKEAWLIAHGQFRRSQIVRWIRDDGMDVEETLRTIKLSLPEGTDPESPEAVFKLYNYWLWVAKHPIRQNPVFGDGSGEKLLKYLKTVSKSEIGIVSAQVVLDDGEYTYHRAEKEYRVPVDKISNVRGVV